VAPCGAAGHGGGIQIPKGQLLFQRASQVYLWALPLITTLGMKNGSEETFGAG